MKKLVSLAIVLILLLGIFAGCKTAPAADNTAETKATEAPPPKPTLPAVLEEAAALVGKWKYEIVFDDLLDYALEQSGVSDEAAADKMIRLYSGLSMLVVIDLREDKTFSITADDASLKTLAETLAERIPEVLPDLIAAFSGMTREELEAELTAADMTMDDLIAQFSAEWNADALIRSMQPEAVSGTYTYRDGKLAFTSRGKTVTYIVERSGDELTVTDITGDTDTILKTLLPVVFVR